MESPGLVIVAILGIGALCVLLPVALATLSESRRSRAVVCPEGGVRASIGIDAARAARGAIFGRQWLTVERCSLWPERGGCAQACLAGLETPSEAPGGPSLQE